MTETVVVERATAIATRKAPSAKLTRMRQPIAPSQRSQSGARRAGALAHVMTTEHHPSRGPADHPPAGVAGLLFAGLLTTRWS